MIDTEEAHLVWRTGSLPTYTFPGADVALDSADEPRHLSEHSRRSGQEQLQAVIVDTPLQSGRWRLVVFERLIERQAGYRLRRGST